MWDPAYVRITGQGFSSQHSKLLQGNTSSDLIGSCMIMVRTLIESYTKCLKKGGLGMVVHT